MLKSVALFTRAFLFSSDKLFITCLPAELAKTSKDLPGRSFSLTKFIFQQLSLRKGERAPYPRYAGDVFVYMQYMSAAAAAAEAACVCTLNV